MLTTPPYKTNKLNQQKKSPLQFDEKERSNFTKKGANFSRLMKETYTTSHSFRIAKKDNLCFYKASKEKSNAGQKGGGEGALTKRHSIKQQSHENL